MVGSRHVQSFLTYTTLVPLKSNISSPSTDMVRPIDANGLTPSAEAPLHILLYHTMGALHTHSLPAALLWQLACDEGHVRRRRLATAKSASRSVCGPTTSSFCLTRNMNWMLRHRQDSGPPILCGLEHLRALTHYPLHSDLAHLRLEG